VGAIFEISLPTCKSGASSPNFSPAPPLLVTSVKFLGYQLRQVDFVEEGGQMMIKACDKAIPTSTSSKTLNKANLRVWLKMSINAFLLFLGVGSLNGWQLAEY